MNFLEIRGLSKRFGTQTIFHDLNLTVAKGEVLAILGGSGNGKSTLLRCINGLETAESGTVSLAGQRFGTDISWPAARQRVGMVFQNYELFHHLSVWDNILLAPLKVQGRERAEVEGQAAALLTRVGLLDKKDALPRQLSGGQKQRIAIVRALAMNPEVLLLDEITASLDPLMVREVLDVVQELARDGRTMLIVTHELGFARRVADRIIFLHGGRIEADQKPEEFFNHPASAAAARFVAEELRY